MGMISARCAEASARIPVSTENLRHGGTWSHEHQCGECPSCVFLHLGCFRLRLASFPRAGPYDASARTTCRTASRVERRWMCSRSAVVDQAVVVATACLVYQVLKVLEHRSVESDRNLRFAGLQPDHRTALRAREVDVALPLSHDPFHRRDRVLLGRTRYARSSSRSTRRRAPSTWPSDDSMARRSASFIAV